MQIRLNILGGCNIEGEDDAYDFGSGAGFYINATEEKWKNHYRMYSYVTKEVIIYRFLNLKYCKHCHL